jgi:hypothetical protein
MRAVIAQHAGVKQRLVEVEDDRGHCVSRFAYTGGGPPEGDSTMAYGRLLPTSWREFLSEAFAPAHGMCGRALRN